MKLSTHNARSLVPAAVASFLLLATASAQEIKIAPADGAAVDQFGYSLSLDGGLALGGAPFGEGVQPNAGAAYVFDSASGLELAKLTASDGIQGDVFGYSLCLRAGQALVGAPRATTAGGGIWAGAAYLYDVSSGVELMKLAAPSGASGEQFGWSVSADGGVALIGTPEDDTMATNAGAAYLFDLSTGQMLWKLTAAGGQAGDYLGASVSISGGLALVGAPFHSPSGAAYVFDVATGNPLGILEPTGAVGGSFFGFSVALDGVHALIGAQRDDANGPLSGAAYLFDVSSGQLLRKITASNGFEGDRFGNSVAVSGALALVGAPGVSPSGSAYAFHVVTGTELAEYTASDGEPGDIFGNRVALDARRALFGNHKDDVKGPYSGSAYLFDAGAPDCDGDGVSDADEIAAGAPDCDGNGIPDQCQIADDLSLDWNGDRVLDACSAPNYCLSSGAVMSVSGSPLIATDDLTLIASNLPPGEYGYFMMSDKRGFLPGFGGSLGVLCLGSPLYRFAKPPTGHVLHSGTNGQFQFRADLTNLPQGVVFQPGETWNFQAWFRKGASSDTTDGLTVMLR